ncbi:hypothetical protein E4U41_004136 [Claviceps citrina]|nr:hypothetical protein E4U41_004136 [Claviceps citrina]
MATTILPKIHRLSDLELALLLGLTTREHPILTTPSAHIATLTRELALVAAQTFRLTHAVLHCSPSTTLDDFVSALLLPASSVSPASAASVQQIPERSPSSTNTNTAAAAQPDCSSSSSPSRSIANCILAPDLDLAPHAVQIQALELLRTGRIFTRTSVQPTPKRFLFIPILRASVPGQAPHLTRHLNDFFALAHWHDPRDDGSVNLERERGGGEGTASVDDGSVVKREQEEEKGEEEDMADSPSSAFISDEDINQLAQLSQDVQIDIDVRRYQMNIISFLRMHRAVHDGITPAATKHLDKLTRCLASLHSLDYVTPALVGLAARKTYLHRIRVTAPEDERSLQWGSDLRAVAALLDGVGPEQVIDDVLSIVTAPI